MVLYPIGLAPHLHLQPIDGKSQGPARWPHHSLVSRPSRELVLVLLSFPYSFLVWLLLSYWPAQVVVNEAFRRVQVSEMRGVGVGGGGSGRGLCVYLFSALC